MGGRIITGSVNCSDITVNKDIITEYSNSNTAIAEGTKELEVTVNRREYNIVGDELYIPKRYEDAPQWLRDIIDTVTSTALSNALSDVSTLGDMLDGLIAELNVAKNTYTMSIISDNSINERINTAIETLNSSLAESDSTILNIALTRVTPEQAQAIAIGILSASINGGDISAAVQNLQSAIADVDSARALDYTRLNASIGDEFESTATAISTINAYVGIDEAGASTGTGLSAYLEDSNGVIGGADSQLNNTIKVTAEGIESKFEYNSMVNVNGVYKKSGFGLTTNYTSGSGTEANPYVSEFWIDASRLKFTNSAMTGRTAPFTIEASGTTPQITFNGKVTFSNISDSATYIPTISSVTAAQTTANTAISTIANIKSVNTTENGVTSIPNPVGATYSSDGTVSGALIIVLPTTWTNTMMTLEIEVYDYNTGKSFMLKLGGYNYTSEWLNTSSNLIGSNLLSLNVRFGHNGAKCCVAIGDVTSTWSYPKVKVKNCTFGFSNYAIDTWDNGWSIIATTSFTGYTFTQTHTSSWQQEVQAAINNNATYIDGGKIVTNTLYGNSLVSNSVDATKISSYNLTAVNATFANSIITNATIANGAITNAKIGDAQVTTAKIGDAQITNAKIGALSVDTLKIQDEAVIVPRSASGIGNITLVYTPSVTHSVAIFTEVDTPNVQPTYTDFKINGAIKYTYLTHNILFQTFYAGTTYTMTLTAYLTDTNSGNPLYTFNQKILMLGIKK